MMRKIMLYKSCSGINNKVSAGKLPFNQETGVTDLETGINVLIDKYGGLSTRRGTSLSLAGNYHSAFPVSNNKFLAVKDRSTDSAIYLITVQADGSLIEEGIVSGLSYGNSVEFCVVNGAIYYMNGLQHGYIENGVAYNWPVSEWPRATTSQFIYTPAGEHFDMISSVFVIVKGKELIYTEPGLWGIVDNAINYRRLESNGLMVISVGTGLFISDSKAIYFLEGLNPAKWIPKKVLNYPAKPYCKHHCLIDPSQFDFQTSEPSALFGTVLGPVIGLPNGQAVNLIDKKVAIANKGNRGAIMVVDETIILMSEV